MTGEGASGACRGRVLHCKISALGLAARWVIVVVFCGMLCHGAAAAERGGIRTELIAQVRESMGTASGAEGYRFAPATVLAQGQVIHYTVRISNPNPHYVRGVAVIQPVPINTVYVPGTAAAPGATVSFSVDGGRTFAPADELVLRVEGGTRAAQPASYTHIRWQLRNPLAPGATALARFQAVFR